MLFHTLEFAVFFCIVYSLYLVLPHRLQNRMLLVASYVFYGSWDWRYLSLLVISTLTDYACGLILARTNEGRRRKRIVGASVFVNLSILGVFKYYDFFVTEAQTLLSSFDLAVHPHILGAVLPVGISFYTFQTMSYTIDVYRRKVTPERNLLDFALYVSFFPQLIAGPIERGTRLLPQVLAERRVDLQGFMRGAYFVVWGLFLKVVVADNLATIVDRVYGNWEIFDGLSIVLATYAFAFQIFGDFAGYSFMAIGLGLMMGIELMENFRRPYFTTNIAAFWRRWHISLSSWFRDYAFSPFYLHLERGRWLSRFSLPVRHNVAFFSSLVVCLYLLGLWHGAGWNFGFFGLYHGLTVWLYYMSKRYWDRMPVLIQILLTFHIAAVGWLIFRAPTLDQAWGMLGRIVFEFAPVAPDEVLQMLMSLVALVAIPFAIQILEERNDDAAAVMKLHWMFKQAFLVTVGCLLVVFGKFGGRPFIYFQF